MKNVFLIIIVLSIIVSGCEQDKDSNFIVNKELEGLSLEEFYVNGDSMVPTLKQEEKVYLIRGYYNNNDILRDDIVAYDYAGNDRMLIKIVKILPSDEVYINDNKIIVNGEVLTNSVGKEYSFSSKELEMLGLYIKNGRIPSNSYMLFGDNVGHSLDSRNFGAISKSDIVGKFVLE